MKKLLCLGISFMLFSASLCGCTTSGKTASDESSTSNALRNKDCLVGNIPIDFPLVSSAENLNILVTGRGGIEQSDVLVWQEYERMTGVNVNWTTVSKEDRAEKVHAALTNKQNLDLIIRCKLSATRLTQYGENGLILDLAKDDLLKEYAPNCWKYLQSHPDALASVMNPDGTIYSIPQVNSGAELRVALKMFVNKEWLERLNLSLPKTTDELRELLTAFKEQDANGNGDPNDEIPMCSADWNSTEYSLYGAFGLANRGYHNLAVDSNPETGDVRLFKISESYKDFLTYMRGLFSDGLLDQNFFTMTTDQWVNYATNDRIGVFFSTNLAQLPADKVNNWVSIDEAITGPNGDKMWTAIRANFHSTGAAVIPSTCSNPELALRWLDYFWTDEGTLFYHMGVEGKTYSVLDDETYDYLPSIYDEMTSKNLSFDDVVALYSPYPGGSNPTVEIAPYFMGGEMADVPAEAARALIQYGPTEYWPSFTFTTDENEALNAIRTDIEKFCNNSQIEFITGTLPLTEWDNYKSQVEKMNAEEMLNIYQAAVDRYHVLNTALN